MEKEKEEEEVVAPWPAWPGAEIAKWLSIKTGEIAIYRFITLGPVRVVRIRRAGARKTTELAAVWPDYPEKEVAAHLKLSAGTSVEYVPAPEDGFVSVVKEKFGPEERATLADHSTPG